MSPSESPFHLWIAMDDTRTVVALAPLKVSRNPARHEWGSITDLRAEPETERSESVPRIIVLSTLVLIGSFGLYLTGAPGPVVFLLAVLALGVGSASYLYKPPPATVVTRDEAAFPELHRTLESARERTEFADLLGTAERAGRVLPAVEAAVDPAEGGELLAQVLWEAADVLSRRQQLRPQVSKTQSASAGPAASRAAQALEEQRGAAQALWMQTEAELERIQTALELAAVAAENVVHDSGALKAVREAYEELVAVYGNRN
ncbi:hypothetical protein ACIBCR_30010 [Micromonospora echinospora]|uniref:hypothetical protein n=1 Tax=Micromonospora echinospora TaxID=1877 RepID=UPI0037A078F9